MQFVPFDTIAWHAGYSQWADRSGLNRYSIGIELDNAGRLVRAHNQWARLNTIFAEDQVLRATHKLQSVEMGWEKFPQAQMDALDEVARLLKNTYNFIDVLGHDDVSLSGKLDPVRPSLVEFRNEIMASSQASAMFSRTSCQASSCAQSQKSVRTPPASSPPASGCAGFPPHWVQAQIQPDGTSHR
jgi:hypothetical protein